jgi:hypothetical protein
VEDLDIVFQCTRLVSHKVNFNPMVDGCLNSSIGAALFVVDLHRSFEGIRWAVVERLWDEEERCNENNTGHNAEYTIPLSPTQICHKIASGDDQGRSSNGLHGREPYELGTPLMQEVDFLKEKYELLWINRRLWSVT